MAATPRDEVEKFIHTAADALRRLSQNPIPADIPHWSVTSLEVTIDRNSCLGRGSFGSIYRGEWAGQVRSLLVLQIVQVYDLVVKVVAVKEMHREDAHTVDREQLKVIDRILVVV
jgi:hypothetical protein